ncbi:hypothetical protein BS78_04G165600 [Paspalum vaginatum]|nr:hypothetical protein BS78_04G165600 [Paspalum vaginatum]
MTQGSDQAGAGPANSSWPPSGAGADTAGAMTLGSILTVAGILMLFVFFAFALISLQYCFNACDRDRRDHQGDASARRRRGGPRGDDAIRAAARGVDPDLLRSLPVTVYRAAPGSEGTLDCAVCLAELEDGDEARFLPRCGHGFHAGCVDVWLASHTTCPLCRLTVAKPDSAPPASVPLRPVPHERANYADLLPASVLLGVSSSDRQGGAVAVPTDAAPSSRTTPSTAGSTATTGLVIDIPEMMAPVPTTTTPRDTLKSPASARLRSIRRLWSFGRQGAPGPSSSSTCSCAGAGEEDDLEQGSSVPMSMPKGAAAAGATRGAALHSVAPDGT